MTVVDAHGAIIAGVSGPLPPSFLSQLFSFCRLLASFPWNFCYGKSNFHLFTTSHLIKWSLFCSHPLGVPGLIPVLAACPQFHFSLQIYTLLLLEQTTSSLLVLAVICQDCFFLDSVPVFLCLRIFLSLTITLFSLELLEDHFSHLGIFPSFS